MILSTKRVCISTEPMIVASSKGLWFDFGMAMTGAGCVSWRAAQWVERDVEFIPGCAGLDFPLYK